jgi:hypothetical protein
VDEEQTRDNQPQPLMRYTWLLGLIMLMGIGLDRLWISLDQAVPDAAQSQPLNQLLDFGQGDRAIANPLFYVVASVVQQCFGTSPDQLLWTQAVFGGLLLLGVFRRCATFLGITDQPIKLQQVSSSLVVEPTAEGMPESSG